MLNFDVMMMSALY